MYRDEATDRQVNSRVLDHKFSRSESYLCCIFVKIICVVFLIGGERIFKFC